MLLEALGLGLIATAIGLVLGHLLATRLIELVLRTIGDLYFGSAVTAARRRRHLYLRGAVLGIAGTLVAAAKPALDAARSAPAAVMRRAELERGTRRAADAAAWVAAPLLAASLGVLAIGPRNLYSAFGGLFGVLAASALVIPAVTLLLMSLIERCVGRFLPLAGLLALRGVGSSLSRTGTATAALAVAVATVNGVGLMISSFRTSLADWLGTTLTADLYVGFDSAAPLSDAELARIASIAGVKGMSLTRTVRVPTAAGELAIRARATRSRRLGARDRLGRRYAVAGRSCPGRGAVASERFAFARNLAVGDVLLLPTPAGEERVPILGTFRDFNTGDYSIVVALDWYRAHWADDTLTGLGVYVEQGRGARGRRGADSVCRPGTVANPLDRGNSADIAADLRSNLSDHGGVEDSRRAGRVSRRLERAAVDRARARP